MHEVQLHEHKGYQQRPDNLNLIEEKIGNMLELIGLWGSSIY